MDRLLRLLMTMPLYHPSPSVIIPKKTQPFTQRQLQESYQVFHRESALIAYQINKRPVNAHSTAADGVKMAARFMCVTS